ncbi:AAA-like domain-containing protein [Anabaena subtropica]|uniref:AAA-like domain-containing protein n=1 Tax=Anabaena subtropica TaxID=425380 RepID=UPI001F54DD71|nr:AAA-like domain-containing protein [Anabaena subtropica]
MESPSIPVSFNSKFYILRPPVEERIYAEIAKPGGIIRIKASKKMGKTSLILRVITQATKQGDRYTPACELYRLYFRNQIITES